MKTILIDFLGCKVNSYEVEAVAKSFLDKGYVYYEKSESDPDVIIINTCAVTETSIVKDKKLIKRYRREYPTSILVVMGCFAQFKGNYILEELGANIVIGTSHRDEIYDLVEEFKTNFRPICLHDEHNDIKKYERLFLNEYKRNTRAYVKIQDGCNNFCSYCLIPYVRGRSRSRIASDIIEEIKTFVSNGYKEVVLTGIDMSSYGLDLIEKTTLSDLIEKILIEVPSLYRLRISSIEESLIDDKFIYLLSKYENFANHLHMPLQSGSKRIVELMNRKYNLEAFEEKINKIRNVRPDISITTDVIVGFPSETEEEFMETYNFCKHIKFSKIHVFPFSPREGTVAFKMKNQVPQDIKKRRTHELLDLSSKLEKEYANLFDGKEIEFLLESLDEKTGAYLGHSSNYLVFGTKSDKSLTNEVVKLRYDSNLFDNVKME